MTVATSVVVPYADFLARRERRSRIASELVRHDSRGTVDATPLSEVACWESGRRNHESSGAIRSGAAAAAPAHASTPTSV
jgi:hypothetical protein